MKKIYITILTALITFSLFAQDDHLKFKGTPIDGSLSEFINAMKVVGLTHIGTRDGMAVLEGDFAGFKKCTVFVYTILPLDVVSQVGVMFPLRETWSALERDYDFLKSMLTEKYSNPIDVVEEFEKNIQDDNYKIMELRLHRCKWHSVFQNKSGKIRLSIEHFDGQEFVFLSYKDKINTDKVKKLAMEDL